MVYAIKIMLVLELLYTLISVMCWKCVWKS